MEDKQDKKYVYIFFLLDNVGLILFGLIVIFLMIHSGYTCQGIFKTYGTC